MTALAVKNVIKILQYVPITTEITTTIEIGIIMVSRTFQIFTPGQKSG